MTYLSVDAHSNTTSVRHPDIRVQPRGNPLPIPGAAGSATQQGVYASVDDLFV